MRILLFVRETNTNTNSTIQNKQPYEISNRNKQVALYVVSNVCRMCRARPCILSCILLRPPVARRPDARAAGRPGAPGATQIGGRRPG